MFIGQRRYESQQRSNKGMVWRNPWVPGQIGASPIQHWSALHIWLYLFSTGIEFNSLYEQGLERIGCWLCPASDLGDFKLISEHHPDYQKWTQFLEKYSRTRNYSRSWVENGLWRWKKIPKGIRNLFKEKKIEIRLSPAASGGDENDVGVIKLDPVEGYEEPLRLHLAEGYTDCKYGLSLEGVFNKELDLHRIGNIANILGTVSFDEFNSYCTIDDRLDIFGEGGIVVKGKSPKDIKNKMSKLRTVIFRALECVGCGICIGRCENNALRLKSRDGLEKITVIENLCTHCGSCLGPCPVVNFDAGDTFEM
jgi:phosphoadenosine phosphosulfate reductase